MAQVVARDNLVMPSGRMLPGGGASLSCFDSTHGARANEGGALLGTELRLGLLRERPVFLSPLQLRTHPDV